MGGLDRGREVSKGRFLRLRDGIGCRSRFSNHEVAEDVVDRECRRNDGSRWGSGVLW